MDNFNYLEADSSEFLKPYVDTAISTFETGDITQLQYDLFEFYSLLNKPGSGKLITGFSQKDRLCEVFNLCLEFDWMNDSDIREVWAEDAFYCIVEYFNKAQTKQDRTAAALDLFLTCGYGKDSLKTEFDNILRKARVHPIHRNIFSQEEYAGGANYLIREFASFSVTFISPIVKMHPYIIPHKLETVYETAEADIEFATFTLDGITRKMSFISAVIGSILDRM